jgi:sodium-dependent dicarboxylate transporter 2/3/5
LQRKLISAGPRCYCSAVLEPADRGDGGARAVRPLRVLAGLLAAAAVFALPGLFADLGPAAPRAAAAAAVTVLMAVWWLTEALPIYLTALVPLAAYPLLGVFAAGPVAALTGLAGAYFDPYIFLFAGGMAIAAAMQATRLHQRLALSVLSAIGTRGDRLLAGVLAATAAVSLWISNTATAAMMVPIAIALVKTLEARNGGVRLERFGMAVMLAVAWGANIGGIGTKIGTAPNAQLAGFLERIGQPISFLQFMALGLPFVLLLLPIAWWLLSRLGRPDRPQQDARAEVRRELAALGNVRRAERIVMMVFVGAAALWIGSRPLTAWVAALAAPTRIGSAHVEAAIAVGAALLLLVARAGGRQVTPVAALATVPWETLLLLGGGFAMAAGIQESGLSGWMAGRLAAAQALPALGQIAVASLAAVTLSAFASNTATVAILLVVLKDAVAANALHSALVAATFAASCDFALPVGTPPNAIVFGSGYVRIPVMARYGAALDLLAALAAALWCAFAVPLVL